MFEEKKEEKNTLHVLHGIQNFAVGLFEKYIALSTKTKTTSWPWANECPSKWNFIKTENRRKKTPHPNVLYVFILTIHI